jgi:hypothetical protein
MVTITHHPQRGTVLRCFHQRRDLAPLLRPVGWSQGPDGGTWRLRRSAAAPADSRRVQLTARNLRRAGFSVQDCTRAEANR